MRLRSKLGTGTVVRITLPREPQQPSAKAVGRGVAGAQADLQRRRHFAGDLHQGRDQRRHRIALRDHHADAVIDDGIDDRNAADGVRQPQRLRQLRRHHAGPAPGLDVGIEHQQRVRRQRRHRLGADRRQRAVDDAAVLHVRRQQAQRHLADFLPGHLLAIAEHRIGRRQQAIALVVERNGANLADRLVLDIGQPGIDLEIFQQPQHVGRGAGLDLKAHVGIARAERRRQLRHHAEHGRDRRDPDLAGELVLEAVDLLPHRAGVADDPPRPVERAFALRRKALKARAALHQHDAENFLELLEAGRHGRLGDAAGLRGPSEMPLLCERQQKFKLIDQGDGPRKCGGKGGRPAARNSTDRRPSNTSKAASGGLDFRGNSVLVSPHSPTLSALSRQVSWVETDFSQHLPE